MTTLTIPKSCKYSSVLIEFSKDEIVIKLECVNISFKVKDDSNLCLFNGMAATLFLIILCKSVLSYDSFIESVSKIIETS